MGWKWDSASLSHNIWKELSHSDKPWKGKPALTGLQLQTSGNALPVPIVYGQAKVAPNLMWQGDFEAHRDNAGKGGQPAGSGEYNYNCSIILGVCEGPINDINNIWRDLYSKTTSGNFITLYGAEEFEGSYSQMPWSFLTTNHPTEALAYRGIAYLAIPHYPFGHDPTVPQHNFEVNGILYNTGIGSTVVDADPALMIQDFITNEHYGTPFNPACLDLDTLLSSPAAPTTGDGAMQTYCTAMGFALSPTLSDTDNADVIIQNWLTATNTETVWSGDKLKFIPYGDEVVEANGVKFDPTELIAVRYNLTDADFVYDEGEDPVTFERVDPSDAKNCVYVEIMNRADDYNLKPMPAKDQASINMYGLLQADTIKAHDIKTMAHGDAIAHLWLQRTAYVRNTYSFKLSQRFIRLEAMDVVTLTHAPLGLVNYPVRITEVEENDDGILEVQAEDFPAGIGTTGVYNTQAAEQVIINQAVDPGDTEDPIIIEPPASLTGGVPEVWIAASSTDPNWGGCEVWISTDDVTYTKIGNIGISCRTGVTTAGLASFGGTNPDTTHTLSVDMTQSQSQLDGVNAIDAENGVTLSWVDGEIVSYQNSALTSTYHYDLTTLYRGLYGTLAATHSSGVNFVRLDDSIFKYQLPAAYIGLPLYFKFPAVNQFGNSTQDISTLTATNYSPAGTAWDLLPPTGFTATSAKLSSLLSWTPTTSDIVSGYNVYAANNHSATFGTATKIGTVAPGSNTWTHAGLTAGALWRYFLTAYNDVDESAPAGPQDTTVTNTSLAFTDLSDVPSSYTGQAGKTLIVNAGETGVTFGTGGGGGGGISTFWPTTPTVPSIASTGLSLVQGTAGNGALADTTRGMILSVTSAGNTDRVAVARKAVPNGAGVPFVMTALLQPNMTNGTFRSFGLFVNDNGTGRYEQFCFGTISNGNALARRIMRYTALGTYSASPGDLTGGGPMVTGPIWLRLELTSTNLDFYYSNDGENWVLQFREAKATWLASITHCGFSCIFNDNVGSSVSGTTVESVHCFSFSAV